MKKSIQNKIIPGILESDLKVIKSDIKTLNSYFINKTIRKLQLDICDGDFVKSVTYGASKKELLSLFSIVNNIKDIAFQFDMMIKMKGFTNKDKRENTLDIMIETFEHLQSGEIIIHYDSMNKDEWEYLLLSIKKSIKIIPAFNYKNFDENNFLEIIDFIKQNNFKLLQIMGIKVIGKQGDKFMDNVIDIIKKVKIQLPKVKIQIDGGVNIINIETIISAGADNVIFGSQIFKGDVKTNLQNIFK